jgi:arylsulfatase A-like enzyme
MKKGKERGLPARIGEESGQDARAPFVKRKLVSLFFLTLIISARSVLAAEAPKPNIVFILDDNVGYGVLSCYNGGILDTPTPRLDKLAAEGLRLTNFNVENQCTPSRAALMTGRLPIRSGIGKAIAAGAPGGLHPWEITIAEMLGEAGYRTAMFGKWHLGSGQGRLPTDQGFDEWFGFETTDIIYWNGKPGMPLKDVDYIREARKGEKPHNVQVYDEAARRQIDRKLTDRAADYITKNGKSDRPFFLYVPFAFAHHPVLAHPDFEGKSPAGEFGDSLLEHDYNVGRILDALTAAGVADNTVVIWASDNGPSPPGGRLAIPVRGAARSAQCWKETSAPPASFAGQAKYLAGASATRSSRWLTSFLRSRASQAGKSRPTVR